ncbi:hypothetical protein ATANTOWER_016246 [Ataeniobius toweri]|uniref:Secreted protein n=1 Tax=Ataeniobius toweri TaxID=208326 RepID=A0ABU7AZL8_9TELE|nr:hypothetical protein [Ataeniobius toweri]
MITLCILWSHLEYIYWTMFCTHAAEYDSSGYRKTCPVQYLQCFHCEVCYILVLAKIRWDLCPLIPNGFSLVLLSSVAKLVRWLGSRSPKSIRSAAFADLHTAGSILPSHSPFAGFQTVTTWNALWPWRYTVFC